MDSETITKNEIPYKRNHVIRPRIICLCYKGGGDTPLRPGSSSKTRFDTGAYRGVQGRPGASRDKSLKMT